MAVLGNVTLTHTGAVSTAHGGFVVGAFTTPIYLGMLLKRNGLGGGVVNGQNGQDQYLNYGTPITIQQTGEFLVANAPGGILYKFVQLGLITVA